MFAHLIEAADDQSLWTAYSQGFRPESDSFRQAAERIREAWREATDGVAPDLIESLWKSFSPDNSPRFLMELIKVDQAERLKAGKPIELGFYLERFPVLKLEDDRVVSLAYAEFCAREEQGENVSVDTFCKKYPNWSDSIRRQLDLHEMLSIPSNELGGHEQARHFPKAGEKVDRFELVRELGRGGSARVFLAHDLSLGRRCVALKISGDRSTEHEILARLDHDNIVPVLSVHDAPNGLRLICMPYRGEMTLDRLLTRLFADDRPSPARAREFLEAIEQKSTADGENAQVEGPEGGWADFPKDGDFCRAIAWIGWKIAGALAHAHRMEVFHRDIKPANILISLKSGPQLLDFNMARDPEAVHAVEDRIRGGTLPYMAPEQLGAFLDATLWSEIREPADIYSLGLVLEEYLRGKRVEVPLAGKVPVKNQVRALLRQRDLPRVSLRTQNPCVPHALDAILAKATAFRPFDRYRTADEFAEDLRRFQAGRPLKFAFNPSSRERLKARLRPLAKPAIIAAAILTISFASREWIGGGTPLPQIAGVEPAVIRATIARDYPAALRLLNASPAGEQPTSTPNTARDLLRLIAWIESKPGDPQAEELLKTLIERRDLDEAISQIHGLTSENRHLDFLPAYRDYCKLSSESARNPAGNLEWQNLESRFRRLIDKWANDVRLYGFTAHMASMRADFVTARDLAEQGLKTLREFPTDKYRNVRDDLTRRTILYSHSIGMARLKGNDPRSAIPELERSLSEIDNLRKTAEPDFESIDPDGTIDYIEILNGLGLADSLTDLHQYDKAMARYGEVSRRIRELADSQLIDRDRQRLEQEIRIRQERLRSLDKQSGLIQPPNSQ